MKRKTGHGCIQLTLCRFLDPCAYVCAHACVCFWCASVWRGRSCCLLPDLSHVNMDTLWGGAEWQRLWELLAHKHTRRNTHTHTDWELRQVGKTCSARLPLNLCQQSINRRGGAAGEGGMEISSEKKTRWREEGRRSEGKLTFRGTKTNLFIYYNSMLDWAKSYLSVNVIRTEEE